MSKQFDKALEECIRELETGAHLETVLARHPEQAGELRPHLQVWASLSAAEAGRASPAGRALGMARLAAAVSGSERSQGGIRSMDKLANSGGFALKLLGSAAVVAGLALGVTFLTGNLHVEFGSGGAEASHTHPCLDEVLGNLADPQDGHFDVDDLIAARDAIDNQNTDPRYDRDGDNDVDIDDIMIYIGELKTCLGI